jgi:hypothetical protein
MDNILTNYIVIQYYKAFYFLLFLLKKCQNTEGPLF